jgi:hypothetical protein
LKEKLEIVNFSGICQHSEQTKILENCFISVLFSKKISILTKPFPILKAKLKESFNLFVSAELLSL